MCKGLTALVVEGRTKKGVYTASPFLLLADLARAGFAVKKPVIYKRYGIPGTGGKTWLRNDYEPVICFTKNGKLSWSDNTACGAPPKFKPGGEMSCRDQRGMRINEKGDLVKVKTGGVGGRKKSGEIRDRESGGRSKIDPHIVNPGNVLDVELIPQSSISKNPVRGGRRPDGHKRIEEAGNQKGYSQPEIANPGNIIECGAVGGGNTGHEMSHEGEAPFPEKLPMFFIRSFCPPGGVVLDPFCGSGTTLGEAVKCGRRFVGCDLRPSQVKLSERRVKVAQEEQGFGL